MRVVSAVLLACCTTVLADGTQHHAAHGEHAVHAVHNSHGEPDEREGRAQRTNLFNHGNNNNGGGGGAVDAGYGPPDAGYGAPSGGGGGSGYGAPCDSYGCGGGGGGGGGGAPVYVYQQGQGQQQTGGGGLLGGAGGLAALLPLGALALLLPLGLLAIGTIFPTTAIVGRRKRNAEFSNSTLVEQHALLLQHYMDDFGVGQESALQKDMVAKYLQCTDSDPHAPSFPGCLEKLSCIFHDRSTQITATEKEVASAVLQSILNNEFITPTFKRRIQIAGQTGYSYPGSCHKYRCHHHLLPQAEKKASKKTLKSKKKLWKKPYF